MTDTAFPSLTTLDLTDNWLGGEPSLFVYGGMMPVEVDAVHDNLNKGRLC